MKGEALADYNRFLVQFDIEADFLAKIFELQNLGFSLDRNLGSFPTGWCGWFVTKDKSEMNELQAALIIRSAGDVLKIGMENLK